MNFRMLAVAHDVVKILEEVSLPERFVDATLFPKAFQIYIGQNPRNGIGTCKQTLVVICDDRISLKKYDAAGVYTGISTYTVAHGFKAFKADLLESIQYLIPAPIPQAA